MKTILVATDFSPSASNAADYAVQLAKAFKSELLLLHVFHVPIPVSAAAAISGNELQAINDELLSKEAARLSDGSGIKIKTMATIGSVVNEILEQSKTTGMIVTGMKGSGFIKEKLIGSTSTALLSKTKCPMMVIPEDYVFKTPEKIILACDYDNHSQVSSLNHLQLFISTFNLKLFVVNVKTNKTVPPLGDATEADIKHLSRDNEPVFYFPENEDPVEGINSMVKEKQADIVAVIPHHYHFLEGLFHQSISRRVAFHSHVPLLVLPEK
jgi:nucleotide-binding universal stress UspA family protein